MSELRTEGTPLPRTHVVSELGLSVQLVCDDELSGGADITPHMHTPGTDCLRTSVLAAWTDTLTGMLAIAPMAPRVPVTLDLTVELHRLPHRVAQVTARSRLLKAGRTAVIAEVDFDADGAPAGIATASFLPTLDPVPSLPSLPEIVAFHGSHRGQLNQPLAERARCRRLSPGVAELPRTHDGLNAANTINGGLIALVLEEAALSAAPGMTLTSLAIRYLRAARVGPLVARAVTFGELARIEIRDTGSDDRLVALGTSRVVPADG